MPPSDKEFTQTENEWNLDALYTDLSVVKGKHLTPVEKLHLRGLLCGLSPAEIAQKLHKSVKGVESEVCRTLYVYVKYLVGKSSHKVENWRNITEWLENHGYKKKLNRSIPINQLLLDQSIVDITKISIENHQIVLQLNLIVPMSQDSTTTCATER